MFDTPSELASKIALGQDTSRELKSVSFRGDKIEGPRRSELADEIGAMANTADAVLVLKHAATPGTEGLALFRKCAFS